MKAPMKKIAKKAENPHAKHENHLFEKPKPMKTNTPADRAKIKAIGGMKTKKDCK